MKIFSVIREALFGEPVDYTAVLEKGGVLIDVRTPTEFKSGHAKGSENIPSQSFSAKQIQKLKCKEVVLVCQSGARAAQVKHKLQNQGITTHNAGSWRRI